MSDLRDNVTNMLLGAYDDGRRDCKKTLEESMELIINEIPNISAKQMIEMIKKVDLDKGRDDR